MKVKNITNGPKGLNSIDGPVEVLPGQTVDVEMTNGEIASSKRMQWFEFSGPSGKDDDPDADDREELKKQAGELGIDFAKNISTEKLKELIDAKLAQ